VKKSEIQILVVDDDITVLRVLEGAIKKFGFKPLVAKNIDLALQQVRLVQVHAAIIDCMLPAKNGVDLAIEFRDTRFGKQPIILSSGIFKDKNFIDEAKTNAKAVDFLVKPINLERLEELLNEHLANLISEETVPLHKLISKGYESARERRKAIESLEEVSGYDLPFILSVLMEAKVGGHFNIFNQAGGIYGISLCKGLVTNVDSPDSAATLALSLIQQGIITQEDFIELGGKALRGDLLKTLLNEALISPHSVNDIRKQQTIAEVKNLIKPEILQFNFAPERLKEDIPGVSLDELMPLFNEVTEKILDIKYVKDFYKDWGEFPILKGPQYSKELSLQSFSILNSTPNIHRSAEQNFTINELIETRAFEPDQIFKAIHLLTLKRVIIFDTEKKGLAGKSLAEKVVHVYEKVKLMKPEEVFMYFGATEAVSVAEVQKIYKEFAKTNHPDKMVGVSAEIKDTATRLFSKVSEAHDILGNDEAREKYYNDIKQAAAKRQIEAEELTQKAKSLLKKNSFLQAFELLTKAYGLYKGTDIELHYLWARLKITEQQTPENLKQTDLVLKGYDSEDKRTALYQFVLGLLKKANKDMMGAMACFDKAMTYDPDFLDARRESVLLQNHKGPLTGKDLLSADLGDIMGSLFKNRK
jgi:DNA-binding response OmpR family regulator